MNYTSSNESNEFIQQWIAEKLDAEAIKQKLTVQGFSEEDIVSHIRLFRKAVYEKKQSRGFIILGTGAFLGFISCVLTLTNPIPDLYNWILYGLTSVALSLIMWGLILILE
ncbi:hypothetical protein I5907_11765 [Panacibacter sp. DH6]|uniref:DUF2157 domain-containing protein n=1 Tax=Panacibacter microcysteis TaxID=2793269 RepID=A0A931GWX2_9BACT|nr:hypothetical protein [Panacibacter microcysteis]MBG9376918.1 hypothetical protein [Panacibacter microcysteis]